MAATLICCEGPRPPDHAVDRIDVADADRPKKVGMIAAPWQGDHAMIAAVSAPVTKA
jgi:hypothetical protein